MSLMYLAAGLLLFLGVHSVRVFANDWRNQTLARIGEKPFKGVYALLSIVGFVLLVWGYGQARQQGVMLWNPPVATRHLAALLTLIAFVLLAAAYVPGNQIKAKLHHPMVLGTKVWALAHLLANGSVASVVLFGSFLLWSAALLRSKWLSSAIGSAADSKYLASGQARTVVPCLRSPSAALRRCSFSITSPPENTSAATMPSR